MMECVCNIQCMTEGLYCCIDKSPIPDSIEKNNTILATKLRSAVQSCFNPGSCRSDMTNVPVNCNDSPSGSLAITPTSVTVLSILLETVTLVLINSLPINF